MWVIVRPACGPGSLPAGIHTDGSDPHWLGGGCATPGATPGATPPHRLTAPAVKKGGSLPSSPSPLARLWSSGLGRKTRTRTAKNGRVVCHTPPLLLPHPPLCPRGISPALRSALRPATERGYTGGSIRSPPRGQSAARLTISGSGQSPPAPSLWGRAFGKFTQRHESFNGLRVSTPLAE